ncbi:MAG: PD40 domain-containing protein [Fimbriimonadales bacterium]|jgi:WD40 repeat protein|nr:PD40 domain-containing protein [Fimbriimonadales bacterium]GIV13987.1 MAG: hypothetical protein KatS3mg021_2269 [Fimbriimonadales bacterium]CUU03293.1 WD40 repeat [Armatimonadetes bacterium GBS]
MGQYRVMSLLGWCLLLIAAGWCQNRPDVLWIAGGHAIGVSHVAFSPDGQYIASVSSRDSTLKVWRVADGQLLYTFREADGAYAVAFSPDGRFLAVGVAGSSFTPQTLLIRRASDGALVRTFTGHQGWTQAVAFSPDGQVLISGGADGLVRVWNLTDGTQLRSLSAHPTTLTVAYSPMGTHIASGGDDSTVKIYSTAAWSLLRTLTGHTGAVTGVAFAPSGQILASGSTDGTIRVWNVSNGSLIRTISASLPVYAVAFSPDGQYLAGALASGGVSLWNASSGALVRQINAHTGIAFSLAFSGDSLRFVSGGEDGIRLWRVSDGSPLRTFTTHTHEIRAVALSSDGQYVASASLDRTVRLWRAANGQPVRAFRGHTDGVLTVAFAPNGQLLASGGLDRTVRLWEVNSGALAATLSGHTNRVTSVLFMPSGDFLVSGSWDGTLRMWHVPSQSLVNAINLNFWINEITLLPDGQHVIAVGSGHIAVVNPLTGHILTYQYTGEVSYCVALTHATQRIAIGTSELSSLIVLLRLSDFTFESALSGHIGGVHTVASYGKYLVSGGGSDAAIRFWRADTSMELELYDTETGNGIMAVRFAPNGRALAVGRKDATLMLIRNPFWQQGDADGNGCVDDADLLMVLFQFGESGESLPADMNEDGLIDDADLLSVLFHFGNGCSA